MNKRDFNVVGNEGTDNQELAKGIISIEKYKYTPSLELAFKIAETFDVSIDEVFDHREEK